MSKTPSRHARELHARLLLCLLALATVLRALVPVGYMPDAAALRQGKLQISFCSAAGGPPTVLTALMETRAAPDHANAHDGGQADQADSAQECPFWMVAHQSLDLPPPAIAPVLAAASPTRIAPPAPLSLPPLPAAGPPLGPRAPPFPSLA